MKRILKVIYDNLPLLPFVIVAGLLLFPVWSHIHQSTQIDELVQITGNPGEDQLLGGITRVSVGTGVKWTTDLVPSSSFTVNLGSLALPVNYIFGTAASLSGNLSFSGELKPDNALCSNGQILKKTGANDWDCAADADSGAAGAADSDIPFVTIGNTSSLSFERALTGTANQITVTDGGANGAVTLSIPALLVGTGASFSYGEFTVRASASLFTGAAFGGIDCNDDTDKLMWSAGLFTCGTLADADIPDALTIDTGSTLNTLSIGSGVTWTTTGTLTIGDGGDAVNFNTSTWDVTAGIFSGVLGMTGTGVYDFGGATSFEIPNSAGAGTIDTTGEIGINTSSASVNFYDGTAERVLRDRLCKTWAYEDPTAINEWGRVFFDDPFTITEITTTTSGSNAVGWNMAHGLTGAITTNVFTANKSASGSFRYTSFTDATLADSEYLMLKVTSASAKIENLDVTVCGRTDAP